MLTRLLVLKPDQTAAVACYTFKPVDLISIPVRTHDYVEFSCIDVLADFIA
jgi:hypothetical protein